MMPFIKVPRLRTCDILLVPLSTCFFWVEFPLLYFQWAIKPSRPNASPILHCGRDSGGSKYSDLTILQSIDTFFHPLTEDLYFCKDQQLQNKSAGVRADHGCNAFQAPMWKKIIKFTFLNWNWCIYLFLKGLDLAFGFYNENRCWGGFTSGASKITGAESPHSNVLQQASGREKLCTASTQYGSVSSIQNGTVQSTLLLSEF